MFASRVSARTRRRSAAASKPYSPQRESGSPCGSGEALHAARGEAVGASPKDRADGAAVRRMSANGGDRALLDLHGRKRERRVARVVLEPEADQPVARGDAV